MVADFHTLPVCTSTKTNHPPTENSWPLVRNEEINLLCVWAVWAKWCGGVFMNPHFLPSQGHLAFPKTSSASDDHLQWFQPEAMVKESQSVAAPRRVFASPRPWKMDGRKCQVAKYMNFKHGLLMYIYICICLIVQTQLSHSKDGSVEITPQIVCKIACWNHILYIYFTVPDARGTATNPTPEPRRPMGLAIPIAKTGGFLFGLKLMDKFQKGTSAHLTDCFW